jgi:hypothetical protein
MELRGSVKEAVAPQKYPIQVHLIHTTSVSTRVQSSYRSTNGDGNVEGKGIYQECLGITPANHINILLWQKFCVRAKDYLMAFGSRSCVI